MFFHVRRYNYVISKYIYKILTFYKCESQKLEPLQEKGSIFNLMGYDILDFSKKNDHMNF